MKTWIIQIHKCYGSGSQIILRFREAGYKVKLIELSPELAWILACKQ